MLAMPRHWQERPSPNFNGRPRGTEISAIVLHADAADRIDQSLDWCRRRESKVSYHLMVGRTGNVFLLVHPEHRAWHSGVSELDGVKDCNDYAIGVCLSNRNDGEAYRASQLAEAAAVCSLLCKHYHIPVERIVTHAMVARPIGRKTDPKGLDLSTFHTAVRARMTTR